MQKFIFIFFFLPILPSLSCINKSDRLQKALDSFELEPGLRIELVASEPLVIDPIAMAFDEEGKMYVVENRGYPDSVGGAPTKLGRIARLEDKNGDGKYDQRSEFVTGLSYPNGVLPWRGGIFVTCAPDIFYFKDTTGDGIADIHRVVLTGFSASVTAQIRVSTPILGLDGWIYISGGLNSGEIRSPEHPERSAVSYSSADGRFHPETLEFQVTGGASQYGLCFDPFGRRFGCSNRNPVQQIVMEPWRLRRNPSLLFTKTIQDVSNSEADAKVFPISGAITSADFIPKLIGRSHTGTFTSACGLLIYNGSALTPEHAGNAFICEPAQNLIQRQIIHPEGVSFRSQLPYEGRDFLASTDEWFRPVFLQQGPEGALYVADMHRKVIDHPTYVPEESRSLLDFESGKTDGRIFRIVRKNFKGGKPAEYTKLGSNVSTENIAHALASSEEWVRATAHRLLLERRDMSSVPLIQKCAISGLLPESRIRALWLLHSLDALDAETVMQVITDKEDVIREQAILLSEELCRNHPELQEAVVAAATDTASRVRFNCALVLGNLEGSSVTRALAGIAAHDGSDRWMRAAVLSGIGSRLPEFLYAFHQQQSNTTNAFEAVMKDLGQLFGNGASIRDCRTLLKNTISSGAGGQDEGWKVFTILGLAEGLSGRAEMKNNQTNLLFALLEKGTNNAEKNSLDAFINQVIVLALNSSYPIRNREAATILLGYTDFETAHTILEALLDAKNPPELQLAAVAALARIGDPRGGKLLTAGNTWPTYTPGLRSAVIGALMSKPALIRTLILAIKEGVVSAPEISSVDRERLIKNKDTTISAQATVLFRELEDSGRMQVYNEYRTILDKPADPISGKSVFQKVCSACHTYAGEGGKVGPDLTGINNQPADALLLHILVPNYEVLPAYQSILVQTSDGRSMSGWLVAETENSLTLRTSFGADESILRSNIVSLNNSGLSLMPEGLEKTMTKEELANLLAFLKNGG